MQPRSYQATTLLGNEHPNIEDVLDCNVTSMQPGTRLVGDITCMHVDQGWLYLAVIFDLATRKIIGGQMTTRIRTSLITVALETARLHDHVALGAIFHYT